MEIHELQKAEELRSVVLTVRTYPSSSKWMRDNKVSPSKLFNKALEELMKKEKK